MLQMVAAFQRFQVVKLRNFLYGTVKIMVRLFLEENLAIRTHFRLYNKDVPNDERDNVHGSHPSGSNIMSAIDVMTVKMDQITDQLAQQATTVNSNHCQ